MLKAPWAKNLKAEDLILINKSYIASDYEEQESDIVYKTTINGTEVFFYILLEFQSSIDYRMPLRLFFYISEILREYCKNVNTEIRYDPYVNISKLTIALLNSAGQKPKWRIYCPNSQDCQKSKRD